MLASSHREASHPSEICGDGTTAPPATGRLGNHPVLAPQTLWCATSGRLGDTGPWHECSRSRPSGPLRVRRAHPWDDRGANPPVCPISPSSTSSFGRAIRRSGLRASQSRLLPLRLGAHCPPDPGSWSSPSPLLCRGRSGLPLAWGLNGRLHPRDPLVHLGDLEDPWTVRPPAMKATVRWPSCPAPWASMSADSPIESRKQSPRRSMTISWAPPC